MRARCGAARSSAASASPCCSCSPACSSRGATSNPLLASFGALIALLLWFNLSSQVILIAGAFIVAGVDEEHDRVHARHGAPTLALRRLQRAERRATDAATELASAREAVEQEREAAGASA